MQRGGPQSQTAFQRRADEDRELGYAALLAKTVGKNMCDLLFFIVLNIYIAHGNHDILLDINLFLSQN